MDFSKLLSLGFIFFVQFNFRILSKFSLVFLVLLMNSPIS